MVPAFDVMSCPNLAVPAAVMQHIAQVESSTNLFAIGVVGGHLERQPQNLGEAVATTRMLDAKGYNYSLGIAQVNRGNLARYGLDTYEKAFDGCANLAAGSRILAECYGRASGDWGKAFSCYYSGDFNTGYREGYVQRLLGSINAVPAEARQPITVYPEAREHPAGARTQIAQATATAGSPGYRAALRSIALDTAANVLVTALADPQKALAPAVSSTPDASPAPTAAPSGHFAFVPRVSGPNNPPVEASTAATAPTVASSTQPDAPHRASLHQETGADDAAFVF
jgi:type IV secretion system protein VirB1